MSKINYDLAKRLKDAGFPFVRINGGDKFDRNGYFDFNPEGDQEIGAQHFYVPTLSDLIEACGNRFVHLKRSHDSGSWYAEAYGFGVCIFCQSPEEAVANLYLELNKKV